MARGYHRRKERSERILDYVLAEQKSRKPEVEQTIAIDTTLVEQGTEEIEDDGLSEKGTTQE